MKTAKWKIFIGLGKNSDLWNEETGAHFYTASEAEKQFLADFPQYVPEGNNGIAYYVDPGDPFPDFFEPPPGTAFTGIGGRLIQDEVELGGLWHISFG